MVVGLQHRQVRGAVHAHHHRIILLTVIGGHLDQRAFGVEHHMGVGDNIPIAGGDNARAGALAGLALPGKLRGHRDCGGHHLVVHGLRVQNIARRPFLNLNALGVGGHVHLGTLRLLLILRLLRALRRNLRVGVPFPVKGVVIAEQGAAALAAVRGQGQVHPKDHQSQNREHS